MVALHVRGVRRSVRSIAAHLADDGMVCGHLSSVTAVHFAVCGDERWVDAAGDAVSADEPRRCTVLRDRHGPSVRLVLRRWAEPRYVQSSITPASRLALENARLRAAARVRLADLRASQRRIVEATDLERRRIERDLHDGAQQRLVAVTMLLSSPATTSGGLAGASAAVTAALAALRELSHDALSAVLGAEGLEAAIEDLAARVPLSVDVRLPAAEPQLPLTVQTAAYSAVAAAIDNLLAHGYTDQAGVSAVVNDQELRVTVFTGGPIGGCVSDWQLADVADHVGALSGSLRLTETPATGITMSVTLPCGS
ncbi:MAG: hypothetical protein H0U36_04465 [Nocardioidaceae bacterium]|nr:hypothetical protein [Nocardioidaceae bacterium]